MRSYLSLCVLGISMMLVRVSLAQFQSSGSDILPTIVNGQMTTGAHDDNTGNNVPNVQVYGYAFQQNPDDPYFDQDPGINAPAGSGLSPGSVMSFNVLSGLTYWNGAGPITQTAPPAGEQLQYNFAIYNVYVTGSSGVQAGFNIATVASDQSFHRHLNAFLLAANGNDDPGNGPVASPGIYMLTFQVVDRGVASSTPLYIVYDNGLDASLLNDARTYLRDVYAPLTNLVGLSDYPTDPGNYPSSWTIDANGNWSNSSNWNLAVPSAATDSAMFGAAITMPRTITLDTPQTVGHLSFDNTNAYTLVGSQLTLGDGTAPADVAVNAGSHTIAAPLYLASPTTFAVPSGSTLSISSPISSSSAAAMAKEGAGTLLTGQINTAGINVVQGTLKISPNSAVSITSGLSVAAGATLDLANNGMIVNYTGTSPLAALTADIVQARDGGNWDQPGITSSLIATHYGTAIGIADNATLGANKFEGIPVFNSSVLLRYTWLGDANLDGVVNAQDAALLSSGVANGDSGWQNGDFNYDGVVNGDDFALLMLGAAEQSNPANQAPEPASIIILAFSLLHFLGGRGRSRAADTVNTL